MDLAQCVVACPCNIIVVSSPSHAHVRLHQSVSFYDESAGTFYGATCHGTPQPPYHQGGSGAGASAVGGPSAGQDQADGAPLAGSATAPATLAVDFDLEVFYHSRIADPRCIAVVRGGWGLISSGCSL